MKHKTELRQIPGVGEATEQALLMLGYATIASLQGADPQAMYEQECRLKGQIIDRCQLYMYRCVVYFANTPHPDPEKCRWWYWKDHAE